MMTVARDIIITIPSRFDRDDVLTQLRSCSALRTAWHYCTNRLPRETPARMYFVHAKRVIGSMPVLDQGDFDGRTLLRADGSCLQQPRRFAIRALGAFRAQKPPIAMRGFRGWRYFDAQRAAEHGCSKCGGLEVILDAAGVESPCPACGEDA